MYFHIVRVVEIVAKVVFGEVERDAEFGVVGREVGRANQGDGEFRSEPYVS